MIRNKAQVQGYLLGKLKNSSSCVLEADLVSEDGLAIVSTSKDTALRDKIAALASSVFKPAHKAGEELLFDGVNFVIISGRKLNLYIRAIGNGQVLAILVESGSDWQTIQPEIVRTVQDLRSLASMKSAIELKPDSKG